MSQLDNKFNLGEYQFTDERDQLLFLARTAEAAERYNDMCVCMNQLVVFCTKGKEDLTIDERNLLSVAYKNVIGCCRASWRTLNAEAQDEKNSQLIDKYKAQVVDELREICNNILKILKKLTKKDLIDKIKEKEKLDAQDVLQKPGEAQVFYLKMTGDYYRYLSEAIENENHEKQAANSYKEAFELAERVLEPTHPIRLGLALNYSVCFYEILKDKKKACQLAKDAFDEAISKLDKLEEADYKDSTLIMQLLRDNLTLWTSTDGTEEQRNQVGDGGGD